MEKEYKVNINDIKDLQNFANEVSYHISSDVDAISGRQIVDAKSILGLASVSCAPITVRIHSNDLSEIAYFKSVCEKYLA